MFERCENNKSQGDIGEARAIYEFTKMGYTVCKPLSEGNKYDLVVDTGAELKKVQVKTTTQKTPFDIFKVGLKTSGGNKTCFTKRKREKSDYDILFILAEDGSVWIIPVDELGDNNSVNLGEKYKDFKI